MRVCISGSRRAIGAFVVAVRTCMLLVVASVWLPIAHAAAAYPSQPIRLICVHAPGGAGDLVADVKAGRLIDAADVLKGLRGR